MLAYIHAKRHGLEEQAAEILQLAGKTPEEVAHIPIGGSLLVPPRSVGREQDPVWPLQPINRGLFASFAKPKPEPLPAGVQEVLQANGHSPTAANGAAPSGWGDDDLLVPEEAPKTVELSAAAAADVDGGWGMDDDLMADLPAVAPVVTTSPTAAATGSGATPVGTAVVPVPGPVPTDHWFRTSQIAADHIAAGSFETAMQVCIVERPVAATLSLSKYFTFL